MVSREADSLHSFVLVLSLNFISPSILFSFERRTLQAYFERNWVALLILCFLLPFHFSFSLV